MPYPLMMAELLSLHKGLEGPDKWGWSVPIHYRCVINILMMMCNVSLVLCVQAAAINSPIDVYTMNERAILEFDSPSFGTVMFCVIGASQVGSCNVSAFEGDALRKVTYLALLG